MTLSPDLSLIYPKLVEGLCEAYVRLLQGSCQKVLCKAIEENRWGRWPKSLVLICDSVLD